MRRRDFLTLIGAATATWPLTVLAEVGGVRRIGFLTNSSESDSAAQDRIRFFSQSLNSLGWTEGQNIAIETRWPGPNLDRIQTFAKELIALSCDVIVTTSTPTTAAVSRETETTPIVFTGVSDPVGEGFVGSLARPRRNITGFINYEAPIAGKWLQLLKDIDPSVRRAAILFNPETAPGEGAYFRAPFDEAARLLAIEPFSIPIRSDSDIEAAISSMGREQGGGLVMASDSFMGFHRKQFIECAARSRVPAVYPFRVAIEGGLVSYAPDVSEYFRPVPAYVDRILRGTRPNELPVQVPTKYALVINLKTAKALGLNISQSLLVRADEVIE